MEMALIIVILCDWCLGLIQWLLGYCLWSELVWILKHDQRREKIMALISSYTFESVVSATKQK